jgi:Protein of unknown function (DUF1592)/Protein of unknown function (DUF1588)/Protein of unknown function (DUF1587)/Protein of unknown function (DUF1585)/Protein of unknown function (DUF1595)/Ca-dependent carbohydrate-binding module xylan-binding/Cytochrome C oxidase, cbb3-type, subunit III
MLRTLLLLLPALLSANPQQRWPQDVENLFETYCFDCHADGAKKGGFSLDVFPTLGSMIAKRDAWKRVRENLAYELMPPLDKDQPSSAERKALIQWIDDALFFVDPAKPDPGRVTLRRLNRHEYYNTIHDLTGAKANIDLLPADDSGYGFDNIGDVLTLSPTHLDAYYSAAQGILDTVYGVGTAPKKTIELDMLKDPKTGNEPGFFTNATGEYRINVKAGKYKASFFLYGNKAGDEMVKARIQLGPQNQEITVANADPKTFDIEATLPDGPLVVSVSFLNDFWDEATKADRNLTFDSIILEGPIKENAFSAKQKIFPPRIKGQTDEAYTTLVLRRFLSRAFRRPATDAEISRHLALAKQQSKKGDSVETMLRPALEAALISPHFIFRELYAVLSSAKPGQISPIPELTLASRMSYFLWSSSPDDSTMSMATQQQLKKQLAQESERMIRDPRTEQLIDRFFAQWLQYQDLAFIPIDSKLYPSTKGSMRPLMIRETKEFCLDLWRNNRRIDQLIDADFTFLNEKLASHYQVPGITGDHFRKVSWNDPMRRGILSHASILAVTSNPNRTSPVKRGKWVLETLLDAAPPPPPPNVPSLPPPHEGDAPSTLRAQLELHRKDPACASCHKLMDGIGFAFEAYDVDGRRRPGKIDTEGTLATGEMVDSPASLAKILSNSRRDEFHRAFASKLLTFALGRGLEYFDKPAIDKIVAEAAKENHTLHAYVKATIHSFPFNHYKR